MDWEIIDTGISSRPFRIQPGRTFGRFLTGTNIRYLEDHARHVVAEALASRVARLHRMTFKYVQASRLFIPGSSFDHAKAFVLGRIRDELDRCGTAGLLRLVEGAEIHGPAFGHPTNACGPEDDGIRMIASKNLFDARDRLGRGFHGRSVPSTRALLKATAYLRTMDWTVVRGAKGHWVLKPTRNFSQHRSGAESDSPDQIARTLIARAIHRIIPVSTAAVNARMRAVKDIQGAASVRRDLCSTIDLTIRSLGYSGLLELAGTGVDGVSRNFLGEVR